MFVSGKSFEVRVNPSLSDGYEIFSGIPQDGVLSPALFNVYTADIAIVNETRDLGFQCTDALDIRLRFKLFRAALTRTYHIFKVLTTNDSKVLREVYMHHLKKFRTTLLGKP